MMQETTKLFLTPYDVSVRLDQRGLLIKQLRLWSTPQIQIAIEQISYIQLRKEFLFFGKRGFQINYRLHPKGVLYGSFFVSKQPQAWVDAFNAAGIKLISDTSLI
ncbi:hypothetical protein ACP8Y2_22005 [Herpetosiphon llansteffanensis]